GRPPAAGDRLHLPVAGDRRGPPAERRGPSRAARPGARAGAGRGGGCGGRGGAHARRLPRGARRERDRAAALPPARLQGPGRSPRLLRPRPGRDRDGAAAGRPVSAGAGVDTSVAVGAVRLPNPVIAASGTFGYGTEFAGLVDLGALGALAVRGLSLRPSAGKPAPRLVETPGGMLNAIGLQNIGVETFLRDRLPALRAAGARVIANFWGDTVEEFADCAARLDGAPGLVALELNASSPNRPEWGSILATDPVALGTIVRAVRARVHAVPLWVKLSPNVSDITQ